MSHIRSIPRYLVVGGVSALLSNAILITFDWAGIHYIVSCTVSFAVTVLFAYALHTHWTFGAGRSLGGLIRYGAAMALNLPVSLALLSILSTACGMPMIVAAPATTILLTAFNYLVASILLRPVAPSLTRD